MSFLSNLGKSISTAAAVVTQKSKETYAHMKAAPTQMECTSCNRPIMLPPSLFQWSCSRCTLANELSVEKCTACATPRPTEMKQPTIACTLCEFVNEVPTSNAGVAWIKTKKETKKVVEKTSKMVKDEYAHLKSIPPAFHCEHCNTLLSNPNVPPQYIMQHPEQDRGASSSLPPSDYSSLSYSAPPPSYSDPSAPTPSSSSSSSSSSSQAPQAPPQSEVAIEKVICSVCRKETTVPGSMFTHKVRATTKSMSRNATQMMYSVSSQKFANCPICQHPNKLVPPLNSVPASAPSSSSSSGPAPPQPPPPPIRLEVACEKCTSRFPAVYQP